jgi:hypothetical protein
MGSDETPSSPTRSSLASVLTVISFAALALASYTMFGGQFMASVGPIPLTIRSPRNPLIIFGAAAGLAAWLDPVRVHAAWARLDSWMTSAAIPIASLIAAAVFVTAVRFGSFVAGGADSSGYVSQARLLRSGTIERPLALSTEVDWHEKDRTLSPLGYRPAQAGGASVPAYPPGFPAMMAAAQVIGGERVGFYVVPLCAAGTVLLVSLIGMRLAGPTAGLLSASLLASSPTFLFQAVQPMSDVPAAFWWTLSFYLLQQGSPAAVFAAGLAASIAAIVRPNLWVLAALTVPIVWWWRRSGPSLRLALLFGGGLAPGIVAFALWEQLLYGSLGMTGYGRLQDLFALAHVWPNLQRYPSWLVSLHSPVILLALIAPLVLFLAGDSESRRNAAPVRTAVCALILVVALQAFYLAYSVYDSWAFTRFLLPTLPLVFALVAAVVVTLPRFWAPVRVLVCLLFLVTMVPFGVRTSRARGVFHVAEGERRFGQAAARVASLTPARSAIFSMLHSGSVSYYTDRPIVQWNEVPRGSLRQFAQELSDLGHPPYLLLDDTERADFDARHADETPEKLGLTPIVVVESPRVCLFDLSSSASVGSSFSLASGASDWGGVPYNVAQPY